MVADNAVVLSISSTIKNALLMVVVVAEVVLVDATRKQLLILVITRIDHRLLYIHTQDTKRKNEKQKGSSKCEVLWHL